MYSLISTLIIESVESNMNCASCFASSVFPTPVGPRNMNEPIGLFGSFSPTLFLCIAFTTLSMASSCPMTLDFSTCGICSSLMPSVCAILCTGTPDIIATTSATLSSSTVSLCSDMPSSQFFLAMLRSSFMAFSWSLNPAASSKFCAATAFFFFSFASSSCFSRSSISSGTFMFIMCALEPASSSASIALSGKHLSVMYLSVRRTHAFIASGVYITLWCASYFDCMFCSICMVSSDVVGSTNTFWNLLSSAPSFSMFWRYSSRVVAPMHCTSPLASAGFSMLAASSEPDVLPAPTIVCISSMKSITLGFFCSSFSIAFILSSNCPLYFVPATIAAMSRATTLLSNSTCDTLCLTIFSARPSTMADFPTPGSPMSIGLFFFLRLNIWAILSISLSLPTTGSSLPSSAALVMSMPKLSSTGVSDDIFTR